MNATTDEDEEQKDELDDKIDNTLEKIDRVDEAVDQVVERDQMGEMFPFAEYELEVGQTTVTDDQTGEQYTLWRAEGRPVGTNADGFREVSPHLPEAIMGVCEALERNAGDL